MSRLFVSTLGTNKYIPCKYRLNGSVSDVVPFVQEALVSILCKDWSKEDRIVVFCTRDAEEKNWKDSGNFAEGLGTRLKRCRNSAGIKMVSIPDGKSEKEIMEIFEKMVGEFNPCDEIFLDITHSFRSIPMLASVVLNYAKVLKDIKVGGIYYGAMEAIGKPKDIEKIPEEERIVPVFDLTPFDTLLDWARAINIFLRSGNTEEINVLTNSEVGKLFRTGQGNEEAKKLRHFGRNLHSFFQDILAARGQKIYNTAGKERFGQLLEEIENQSIIPPMKPLLERIRPQLESFDSKDGCTLTFEVIDWCIRHNLIPQAYILLIELVITELCRFHDLDCLNENDRNFVSSLLHVTATSKPQSEWSGELAQRIELARKIQQKKNFGDIAKAMEPSRKRRNDFMHGGWNKTASDSNSLLNEISEYYEKIRPKLEKYTERKAVILLSHELTDKQVNELKSEWKVSEFVRIPENLSNLWRSISPQSPSIGEEIKPLLEWLSNVCESGDLVIVQGDYGASCLVAKWAYDTGCIPLYATTEREVIETKSEGESVTIQRTFHHVRFRKYEFL